MAKKMTRIIVADDHPVVRDGLRLMIERQADDIALVGECGDGNELLELADKCAADVYIVDITMPGMNGLEATRRLIKKKPGANVIILSLHSSRGLDDEALESGARGYLLKENATQDVIAAVREVSQGHVFLSPKISHYVVDRYLGEATPVGRADARAPRRLSPRETEILQLIAEGLSTKNIAQRLGLAVNTVRVHRSNLMSKLDIHKETELVRYAVKEGIAKL